MKITLYTLNVDNYAPEITKHTFPLLAGYANKIGARFYQITERKFPEFGFEREKFQIFDLMVQHDDDYAIFLDADTLLHPEMFDLTCFVPPDTVCNFGHDNISTRFRVDDVHRRDGRNIGCGTFFVVVPRACRNYWLWPDPSELSYEEIVSRIFPTLAERKVGIQPKHLADDFVTSRNVAKFGFKFMTVWDIQKKLGRNDNFIVHSHLQTREQKVQTIDDTLVRWGLAPEHEKVPASEVLGDLTLSTDGPVPIRYPKA